MNRRVLGATLVACAALGGTPGAWAADPLPNLRLAAEGIYVGGEPGAAAYDELVRLGIRTLVSVDGAPPDAESARARGIRVLHVPLGYDGVPDGASAAFLRIAKESERPIYVHCHHGKHRGPAAAAILARAAGAFDAAQAERLLEESGTDPAFRGLWRDVAAFDATRVSAAGVELREATSIDPFALAMAQLGRAWTRVEQGPPAEDLRDDSRHDADLLVFREAVRESIRQAHDYDPTGEIRRRLETLHQAANERGGGLGVVAIESRCASCHSEWRD